MKSDCVGPLPPPPNGKDGPMEFIDAFEPDKSACERKFAFRNWARIDGSFETLGYRVSVSRNRSDIRGFWERLPDEKRPDVERRQTVISACSQSHNGLGRRNNDADNDQHPACGTTEYHWNPKP